MMFYEYECFMNNKLVKIMNETVKERKKEG